MHIRVNKSCCDSQSVVPTQLESELETGHSGGTGARAAQGPEQE